LKHYIDTSVLVAYYYPEALSDSVQIFLREQVQPAVSTLTEVEFFSAIAKKVRTDELDRRDGNRILSKFLAHWGGNFFSIISVELQHWRLARDWIGLFSTPLRTLDALHLSIASIEDLVLVTSDQQLAQAADTLGVKTRIMTADE